MHRFSHQYARLLSYLILAFFLLQLASVPPTAALTIPVATENRPGFRTQMQVEPALTLTATSLADSIIIGETDEILLNIKNEVDVSLSHARLQIPYHPNVRFMDDNGHDLESHTMNLDTLEGHSERSVPLKLQVFGEAPELIELEFIVRVVEIDAVWALPVLIDSKL